MDDSEFHPLAARPPATEGAERPESAANTARVRSVVDRHYDFVWRTLQYLGLPEASVEDAAQQVMCVMARRISEIEEGAEGSFLFATATRVAAEHRRSARRRPQVSEAFDLEQLEAATPGADELLDQRRAREVLAQVLDELPDDLRVVFVLFELEEMTMAAIATLLGIPPGTVASRLRRGRSAFQAAVTRIQAAARRGGGRR
jgi:RNA polymerase sigma-70 factor (ECF subfamily)